MTVSPSPFEHHPLSVGRYAIRRKLGTGSLGTVYLAQDQRTRREVAIKVIRTDRVSSTAVQKLKTEFRAIAALHHPQIARAHDFGYTENDARPFYTREYIPGTPLAPGPPGGEPPGAFLRPILDLLDALEYLHAHGILHLDIHPGNLIVSDDSSRGSVLIDFGLIRSPGPSGLSTGAGPISCFPPELLRRERPSPATDLFLVGRLLLYRLTGRVEGEARLPRDITGWGPRRTLELERIAGKALQTEPARRFRTAAEFRDALSKVLGGPEPKEGAPERGELVAGRERELMRLEEALETARSGKATGLCVVGRAGLGKSRLLREARFLAQLLGLEIVEARFFDEAGPGPALLRALGELEVGRKKLSWLEPLAVEHGGSPEERARRAAAAYFEEKGRPLALLLDDLDLADRESRTLAEALVLEAAERQKAGTVGRGLALIASGTRDPGLRLQKRDLLHLQPLTSSDSRRLFQTLTRPLQVAERLARQAAVKARGSPLRLRQIARALALEWGRAGRVPERAELPELPPDPVTAGLAALGRVDPRDRQVLKALAVLRRPALREEVAAALRMGANDVRRRLSLLEEAELVTAFKSGRAGLYQLNQAELGVNLLRGVPVEESRRIHRRLASFLQRAPRENVPSRENLARHLLLSGRTSSGRQIALEAAAALRRLGFHDRAVRLLEDAMAAQAGARERFRLAEATSSILEEAGDHKKGIAVLEPFYRGEGERLSTAAAVRLRRRLGVHYHRAGRVEQAMAVFEETQQLARPQRNLEDLIFIDSELAELYNLRGLYDRAAEACQRGLDRLSALDAAAEFRLKMEVALRATRGHLLLRRLELPGARRELSRALKLSQRFRMTATQAVILSNLGIVENQLNDFRQAARCFRAAEGLLLRAGERRPVVSIACNLAVIAAKRGDREEAHAQVERADRLLCHYPGTRLKFFAGYTRGVVAGLLGEAGEALEALTRALPLGLQVGDRHLVRFGEVCLAEAYLSCGRYGPALRQLQASLLQAEKDGPPLLVRMVHCRLLVLAALLGRPRLALRSGETLQSTPRSDVLLLEAWNDLFIGLAHLLTGERGTGELEAARRVFRRLKLGSGERFARLGLLLEALAVGNAAAIEGQLRRLEIVPDEANRFLAVAVPLVRAEAYLALGDPTRGGESLSQASGAIVGSPFLELDWQIELLRARLA